MEWQLLTPLKLTLNLPIVSAELQAHLQIDVLKLWSFKSIPYSLKLYLLFKHVAGTHTALSITFACTPNSSLVVDFVPFPN